MFILFFVWLILILLVIILIINLFGFFSHYFFLFHIDIVINVFGSIDFKQVNYYFLKLGGKIRRKAQWTVTHPSTNLHSWCFKRVKKVHVVIYYIQAKVKLIQTVNVHAQYSSSKAVCTKDFKTFNRPILLRPNIYWEISHLR